MSYPLLSRTPTPVSGIPLKQSTQTINAVHMYDLVHSNPSNHSLTAAFFNRFLDHTNNRSINVPEVIESGSKFCESCGNLFVAGWNLRVRIAFGKGTRKSKHKKIKTQAIKAPWKPRSRCLKYECLACGYTKVFPDMLTPATSSTEKSRETKDVTKLDYIPSGFVAEWPAKAVEVPSPTTKTNDAKKRAKKRKMNSLSNMISKKKEADDLAKKKSNSLSLMEFMI